MANQPQALTQIVNQFGPHLSNMTGPAMDSGLEPDRLVKTHCCFCGQQCGIQLKVKDDRVVGFEPWEDFPFNRGMLCPKGVKRYLQGGHPDRLLTALRRDPSAPGGFAPEGYDAAVKRVAQEIERSGFGDRLGAGVVLTGGGASLDGVAELASATFPGPVRVGLPGTGMSGLADTLRRPKFAAATGLVLYGARREVAEGVGGRGGGGACERRDGAVQVVEGLLPLDAHELVEAGEGGETAGKARRHDGSVDGDDAHLRGGRPGASGDVADGLVAPGGAVDGEKDFHCGPFRNGARTGGAVISFSRCCGWRRACDRSSRRPCRGAP